MLLFPFTFINFLSIFFHVPFPFYCEIKRWVYFNLIIQCLSEVLNKLSILWRSGYSVLSHVYIITVF